MERVLHRNETNEHAEENFTKPKASKHWTLTHRTFPDLTSAATFSYSLTSSSILSVNFFAVGVLEVFLAYFILCNSTGGEEWSEEA